MTAFDRIEPRLPELIDELAGAGVPDYFDDMLRMTASAKQRPAWSSLERWLPMGVIARPLPTAHIPWRMLAAAAVLLMLVAGLVIYAGSQTTRVPAPFGPAANGLMFYHGTDGAIYVADPLEGDATAIVRGATTYAYPWPSRDGRHVLYDHTAGDRSQLFVAGADGSDAHPLAGTYQGWTWAEWSPDDRQIGIVSRIDGIKAITVLEADGSGATTLPLDREVLAFWWLPDGGFVFTGAEQPGQACRPDFFENRCALFVVGAGGTDPRMIASAADFAALSTSLSPDGRTVLIDRWTDTEPGRLYLIDVETGAQRPVRIDDLDPLSNSNIAEFSPDGSQILFDHMGVTETRWAIVPTAGGVAVDIGPAWPDNAGGPEAHWAPDGRSVAAFYPAMAPATDRLWLLDATGQGDDRRLTLPADYVPAWQRVAP